MPQHKPTADTSYASGVRTGGGTIVADDDDEMNSHPLGRRKIADGERWYSCNVPGCSWGCYTTDLASAMRAHARARSDYSEKAVQA